MTGRFYLYITTWQHKFAGSTFSLFFHYASFSAVIEQRTVTLDHPGKGVSPWTTKNNCPLSRGRNVLEERSFCLSVLSQQREKRNVTPIIRAVDSVRKTGCFVKLQLEPQLLNQVEGFFVLLALHLAFTLHTTDPSACGLIRCDRHKMHCEMRFQAFRGDGGRQVLNQPLLSKPISNFYGVWEQFSWRRLELQDCSWYLKQ